MYRFQILSAISLKFIKIAILGSYLWLFTVDAIMI